MATERVKVTAEKPKPVAVDVEFAALEAVAKALMSVDDAGRIRILEWATSRFGVYLSDI